jgi:hypothetical protein
LRRQWEKNSLRGDTESVRWDMIDREPAVYRRFPRLGKPPGIIRGPGPRLRFFLLFLSDSVFREVPDDRCNEPFKGFISDHRRLRCRFLRPCSMTTLALR